MSKAEKYHTMNKEQYRLQKDLEFTAQSPGYTPRLVAFVLTNGHLELKGDALNPEQALRLARWLLEVYGE